LQLIEGLISAIAKVLFIASLEFMKSPGFTGYFVFGKCLCFGEVEKICLAG